ncbi:MAG: TonB-dependent receptor [Bacteroidales bacterium]|nr:TonB-dependent receptor [Bacteroidales bacterium]
MKKILPSLLLLLITSQVYSQRAEVTGNITDINSGEKIPFAAISVFDPEFTSLITGTVSNENGEFAIKQLKPGSYRFVVSFIGYTPDTLETLDITPGNNYYRLAEVAISPSFLEIEEVEVRRLSNTSVQKIDRQVYRASDFETAKGGTAVDVLNKLPSVSVDPDGNVSLRGTTDFIVYLNGKPTQMDPSMLLGTIAGNAIENIEVITVPSARYDAQGKGGIINITTRRNAAEGLSISANGFYGSAPWGHLTDKYSGFGQNDNRGGAGLNLTWHKNKLSVYGGFNLNNKNINGMRTGDARILVDEDKGVYKHMVATGERPEWFRNWSANTGFDYRVSEKTTISGSYFHGQRQEGRSAFYVYEVFYADKEKNAVEGVNNASDWIYNPNTDDRYGRFHTANIDMNTRFEDNSELKISLLYEHSGLSRELRNQNFDFNPSTDQVGAEELEYLQKDDTPLDGYRLSVDYSKEMGNGDKLGAGFQPQIFNISGGFRYDTLGIANDQWGPYSSLENDVDQTRAIYAGYVDYSGSAGNLTYLAGFRLEYTDEDLDILKENYFSIFDGEKRSQYLKSQLDLFPTVHLNYALNENNGITFAASRRISRPPIKNMAPFLYRRHLEVYVAGDPRLEPEYMNNMELVFNKKTGRQNVSLVGFYRGVNNAIFRVNTITNENQSVLDVVKEEVLIRSYTNSGNTRSLGAELNTNLEIGTRTKVFIGGSLYNFRVDSDIFGYQSVNQSTNWSAKANVNLFLTKALKFTADFNVKSATVTAQGQNDMFYLANSALSYTPGAMKGWNFSLRGLDILGSNVEGLDTRAFNANGAEIFYQETEYYRQGPIVELAATWSLNMNGKTARKAESAFGKEQF